MARYQVIYGKELGVPGGYKVEYYTAPYTVTADLDRGEGLFKRLAEVFGVKTYNIKYAQDDAGHMLPSIMAGGFNQYMYDIYQDDKKLFSFYYMLVDETGRYI